MIDDVLRGYSDSFTQRVDAYIVDFFNGDLERAKAEIHLYTLDVYPTEYSTDEETGTYLAETVFRFRKKTEEELALERDSWQDS